MGWVTKSWTCPSTHTHPHLSSIIYLLSSMCHPSPIYLAVYLSAVFSLCYWPTLPRSLSFSFLLPPPPLPASPFSPLLPPSHSHSHNNCILFSDKFLQSDRKMGTGNSHLTTFSFSNRESRKLLFLNSSCKIPL